MIGVIPIYVKLNNEDKLVCSSLSFTAGIMLTISIIELIPESFKMFSCFIGLIKIILTLLFLLFGIVLSMFINSRVDDTSNNSLYRVGLISMLVIIIHNIPEGIVTFISTTKSVKLGISLAISISLHNIPEGISISIPIYYATRSKIRAFLYTLISALSEFLGALITYWFLMNIINDIILGCLFSIIAGFMINISITELLPMSISYKNNKLVIIFFLIGILLMILNFVF